jgi:cell division protein FtsW (lipid II flippase)
MVVQRGVVSGLVVFVLFATCFLVWLPVPVSRNAVVHTLVYTLYFLLLSLSIFIRNVQGNRAARWKDLAMGGTTLACLAMWGRFLNREGEAKTISIRQKWAPQQPERLIEQLAAINASLLRTVRK